MSILPQDAEQRAQMLVCVQFGLKDPSLVRAQGFIDGKWVDAKEGGVIKVTSESTAGRVFRRITDWADRPCD